MQRPGSLRPDRSFLGSKGRTKFFGRKCAGCRLGKQQDLADAPMPLQESALARSQYFEWKAALLKALTTRATGSEERSPRHAT